MRTNGARFFPEMIFGEAAGEISGKPGLLITFTL
jgi:hypothetical protein